MRGRRAVDFLGHAVVSDPSTLSDGQAQYSMLCQDDGGIIDDLIVYRLEESGSWSSATRPTGTR